jgi:hypothetical protein
MPPNTASSSAGNIPKEAAKNALIFSLVEQAVGRQKLSRPNDIKKLEIASQAIGLYDKHVDTLGHNACMDAVKRYLEEQGFGHGEAGGADMVTMHGGKVHTLYDPKKLEETIANIEHELDEMKKKMTGDKKGKKKRSKTPFLTILQSLAKLMIENRSPDHHAHMALDVEYLKGLHPFPKPLEDKKAKLPPDEMKKRHAKKVHAQVAMVGYLVKQFDADKNLFINYEDAIIAEYVQAGMKFVKPKGYRKLTHEEKTEVKRDANNWKPGKRMSGK